MKEIPVRSAFVRSTLVVGVLALVVAPLASATSSVNQVAVANGAAYLMAQQSANGSVSVSASDNDFTAIALSATGKSLATVKLSGGVSLRDYLASNLPGPSAKAADWERRILSATADIQSAYSFGGVDAVAKLKSFASDGQLGDAASTGDDFFGIMALSAAGVTNADQTMKDEVAAVLSYQHADGGFGYATAAGSTSDIDDTAAAIVALRAAEEAGASSAAVTSALTNAQAYLAAHKNADGGYPSDPAYGTDSNVSSTAWVLMAFNALGAGDSTAGRAAQSYIKSQQLPDGSFPSPWTPGAGDFFDTDPAVTALAGSTWLVNVFEENLYANAASEDAASPSPTVSPSPSATPTPTPGSVLGVNATPTPTPTPAATASTGTVLGATALPVVGEVSNAILLLWALAIAVTAGIMVVLRQLYIRRHRLG